MGTQLLSAPLYAGSWGEGIYRSTDHGVTWQPANTGITLPMHIQNGLVVNPVTPTQVFAGDYYGGGLYRSNNSGISWTLVLSDTAVRAIAVNPFTPTTVLVGDREEGLYRSVDGGTSWLPIGSAEGLTDPHARALTFAPSAAGVVYAGAGSAIFRSLDAGHTWGISGTLPSSIYAVAVHPATATLLYAGTFAHGVYASENGGATWFTRTQGLPRGAWVTSLDIDPLAPDIIYAGTWDGQVYRTADGGNLWEGLGHLGPVYDVLIHPQAAGPDGTSSVIYAATSTNGVFRGSTLDHLTLSDIGDPQYIHRPFSITLTARDALSFTLSGTSQGQLAALSPEDAALAETLASGGYNGTATLTDTTKTITPSQVTFVNGVAHVTVIIGATDESVVITATTPEGVLVTSNPFNVQWYARVYLPLVLKISN